MKQHSVPQTGQGSRSQVLGANDPRHRRDAQQRLSDRGVAPPLYLDASGRIALDMDALVKLLRDRGIVAGGA
ncbi:MAG: hypothetical protein EKK62_09585 [Acidimicrobiia bacterium]|nr:MAG: hypothetical protein EKK62_09585 [Acidimicrobiia bacterium]